MCCDEYVYNGRTEGGNERWKGRRERKGKKIRQLDYIHAKIPLTPIDPRPKCEHLVGRKQN